MTPRGRKALAPGRRRFLKYGGATVLTAALPSLASAQSKSTELVDIRQFQANSGNDWTLALNQACAIARRVYIPAGDYLIRNAAWPADTEIFGDGDTSVLRMPADANYLFTNDSGSPLLQHNIINLSMHDLQLRGSCDTDGMSEFRHLVSLNGVTGVRFRNVLFCGFRGDGLYLGSGNGGSTERHNADVALSACRFDGINRENRNAISVIDCDGLLVDGCSFSRTSRHNMPGAIDIEPNRHAWHVARNIIIRRNSFSAIGGNAGVISVYVFPETRAPHDILVELNVSRNYLGTGSFFHYNDNRVPSSESPGNNIQVLSNDAQGGASAFVLYAGKGISLVDNTFADFTQTSRIGFPGPGKAVRDVQLDRNRLIRCGSAGQSAVAVYHADGVRFSANRFVDGGNAAFNAAAVQFSRGRSSHVTFEGNVFETGSRARTTAIGRDSAHVLTPETNRFADNILNGLSSVFQAQKP